MRVIVAVTMLVALAAGQGRVVDRVAAVVNGRPVLASEVEAATWYARLSAGADCAPALQRVERAAALQHLEDAMLLEEAASGEGLAVADGAGAEEEAALKAAQPRLAACHLDTRAATAVIRRQVRVLTLLEQHFAGLPTPSEEQITAYYQGTFEPEARRRGVAVAPLETVRGTIVQLLRERQQAEQEQEWIGQLRAVAVIEVKSPW